MAGPVRQGRRMAILFDVVDNATAQMAGINGLAMKLSGTLEDTASAGNLMKASLAGAAVAAGAAAFAMTKMVSVGARLDQTFAVIEESSNATTEQMDQIVSTTQSIAATMPVTMSEVANAFEQMTYAGFDAAEAVESVGAVSEMAVAGGLQMGNAADIMATSLNAFNLEAEQSQTVTSSLAATFANSAIEIDEIGSALQYSSAQMSQLGFDAAETAASIGMLADAGIRGTMAGTSMNQAMGQLMSTTGKTQEALAAAGLAKEDFVDEDGSMKSMVEIVRILEEAMNDVNASQSQIATWTEAVFGRRGARAMQPLIGQSEQLAQKLQDNALATIKDTMNGIEELDQQRMALFMEMEGAEKIDETYQKIQEMDDQELQTYLENEGVSAEDIGSPEEILTQFREEIQSGDVGEEEMQKRLQAMFQMEEEAAAQLTEMLADTSMSVEELESRLEDATAAGELTAAQMNTVAGRLTYLKGSFESVIYTMYTGFRPAVKFILDAMIGFADVLNNNEILLKAFGSALFAASALLISYAAAAGAVVLSTSKFGIALGVASQAMWGLVSSTYASITADGIKQTTIKGLTAAKWRMTAATAASQSATIQQMRANLVAAGSYTTLTGAVRGLTGALKMQAAAMYLANPLAWKLIAVVGAALAIMYAYQNNILGVRDAMNWLADATYAVIGAVRDAVNWFAELNVVGKAVLATLAYLVFPPLGVAMALYTLVDASLDVLYHLGLISESSTTVSGALRNLAGVVAGVGGGIAEEFATFAAKSREAVWQLGEAAYGVMGVLGDIYAGITLMIEGIMVGLVAPEEGMQRLSDSLGKFANAFGRVGPIIDNTVGAITTFVGALHDMNGMAKLAGTALLVLVGPVGWLGGGLLLLGSAVSELIKHMGGLEGIMSAVNREIDGFVGLVMGVVDFFASNKMLLAAPFLALLAPMFGVYKLGGFIRTILFDIVLGGEDAGDVLQSAFGDLLPSLEGNYELLDEILEILDDLTTGGWGIDVGFDLPSMDDLYDGITGWLEDIVTMIKNWWENNKPTLEPGLEEPSTQGGVGGVSDDVDDDSDGSSDDSGSTEPQQQSTTAPADNREVTRMSTRRGIGERLQQAMATRERLQGQRRAMTNASRGSQPQTVQYLSQQPQTAGAGAGASYSHEERQPIEYIDDRTVDVSQDPTIHIEGGSGGVDASMVRQAVEAGMEEAETRALESFIDWLTLGGPDALSGGPGTGGEPTDPTAPGEDEVQEGTGDGSGSGEDGTGEDGSGDGSSGGDDGSGGGGGGGDNGETIPGEDDIVYG